MRPVAASFRTTSPVAETRVTAAKPHRRLPFGQPRPAPASDQHSLRRAGPAADERSGRPRLEGATFRHGLAPAERNQPIAKVRSYHDE